MNNKQQMSVLFLLMFFVFYSASPVLYTINEQQPGESCFMHENAYSSSSSVHILFLNIFLTHLADNPHQDNTSSNHFLIKKAKAVLKSLIDVGKDQSEFSAFSPDLSFSSPVFLVKHAYERSPKPNENSLSFFSGLSPPSVYHLLK